MSPDCTCFVHHDCRNLVRPECFKLFGHLAVETGLGWAGGRQGEVPCVGQPWVADPSVGAVPGSAGEKTRWGQLGEAGASGAARPAAGQGCRGGNSAELASGGLVWLLRGRESLLQYLTG